MKKRGKWKACRTADELAIPGAVKAIDINGIELLDGGLVDNLPVDVVLDRYRTQKHNNSNEINFMQLIDGKATAKAGCTYSWW